MFVDRFNPFLRKLPSARRDARRLSVLVVGGGPSGLAFATSLRAMMGESARIRVMDRRWKRCGGRIVWAGAADGNMRREQVVTLQSGVTALLPEPVRNALFSSGHHSAVWPQGSGSPAACGFPQNIRIRDVEDALLDLARDQDLSLSAEAFDPEGADLSDVDFVAIADGPQSRTRDHCAQVFGRADPAPFSLDGEQIVDTVLGLRVSSRMPASDSVVLTVAQNRFLLNTHDGEGLLYMWLTDAEAAEVRGRGPACASYAPCAQGAPCSARPGGRARHFVPASDPSSFLWPRVQEGLCLFDVPPDGLHSVTAFRLSMSRRAVYSGELSPLGTERPVFGALIGDAAMAINFRVGRGLNNGLCAAVALARTLAAGHRPGRALRRADLVPFEAAMAAYARRNQDMAWRAMIAEDNGRVVPVHKLIARAIEDPRPDTRAARLGRLAQRLHDSAERLSPRLPKPADARAIVSRLKVLSDETLAVLEEAGPWQTQGSAGPEVDLDRVLPALPNARDANVHQFAS